jgi:hypothetical protein
MRSFKTFVVVVCAFGALIVSCNNGASVQGPPTSGKNKNNENENENDKESLDRKEDSTLKPSVTPTGETPIEYPLLAFNAKGTTFCQESLPTSSAVESKLSESKLEIKRVSVKVSCYQKSGPFGTGKCNQTEFDQRINSESLGTITFTRATTEELSKMKKDGHKPPGYAILATKVVTHKGLEYNFSRPLPIFPWPAVKSRYKDIDDVEQTFTAEVTGEKNVSISVSIKMVDSTEDTVTLQFVSTINGSEDRMLYDKFPVPRMAIYTINTEKRDIKSFEATDWFHHKECPHNGQTSLSYKLCSKEKDGEKEDFDCE